MLSPRPFFSFESVISSKANRTIEKIIKREELEGINRDREREIRNGNERREREREMDGHYKTFMCIKEAKHMLSMCVITSVCLKIKIR